MILWTLNYFIAKFEFGVHVHHLIKYIFEVVRKVSHFLFLYGLFLFELFLNAYPLNLFRFIITKALKILGLTICFHFKL
jgi:hypothetical protein